MKNKIRYSDEPMGDLKFITDFLPPPHELVLKEDSVKVKLSLSRQTVDFFKAEAAKRRTPYQRMIRRLLDIYVQGRLLPRGRAGKARRAQRG